MGSDALWLGMEGPTHLGWYRYREGFHESGSNGFLLVKKSVFEGILDRLEAALLPWARGRSTRGVVRGHMPGGQGSPPTWTGTGTGTCQKNIFCVEKRRENIFCVEKMCQDVST